jgi:ATP-dependent exoDNAse (exonuclease V) beta subunit
MPMPMPNSPAARAEAEQRRAADPAASAWVSASAGSGKTKVLIDRVLRLLLDPDQAPRRRCRPGCGNGSANGPSGRRRG